MKSEIDDQLHCSGATKTVLAPADFNGAQDGNLHCSLGHTRERSGRGEFFPFLLVGSVMVLVPQAPCMKGWGWSRDCCSHDQVMRGVASCMVSRAPRRPSQRRADAAKVLELPERRVAKPRLEQGRVTPLGTMTVVPWTRVPVARGEVDARR
jgi:hypothetical protein